MSLESRVRLSQHEKFGFLARSKGVEQVVSRCVKVLNWMRRGEYAVATVYSGLVHFMDAILKSGFYACCLAVTAVFVEDLTEEAFGVAMSGIFLESGQLLIQLVEIGSEVVPLSLTHAFIRSRRGNHDRILKRKLVSLVVVNFLTNPHYVFCIISEYLHLRLFK